LSQEELAARLNVGPNTLSRWETAKNRPTLDHLESLAKSLDVSILQFFPDEHVSSENQSISALLRTAKDLHANDVQLLQEFADVIKAQRLLKSEKVPKRKTT
jgi:transcriptional regulator with XRE-family HTH domain